PMDATMTKAAQGYGMAQLGEVQTGTAQLAEAVAWFGRSNLSLSHCWFGVWLGDTYLLQGEPAQACAVLQDILTTSRELGYLPMEGIAHRVVGHALVGRDSRAAASHLEDAVRILQEIGARNEFAKALVAQAELQRVLGDQARARQLLEP